MILAESKKERKKGRVWKGDVWKWGRKRTVLDAREWVTVGHMNASLEDSKRVAYVSVWVCYRLWSVPKGVGYIGFLIPFPSLSAKDCQRPLHENDHFQLSLFSSSLPSVCPLSPLECVLDTLSLFFLCVALFLFLYYIWIDFVHHWVTIWYWMMGSAKAHYKDFEKTTCKPFFFF